MPTNRKRVDRVMRPVLNQAAIEAWRIGDAVTLSRALQIKPWQYHVWPTAVYSLGVDPDDRPEDADQPHRGWQRAVDLQRALLEICPPGRVGRHGLPLGPAYAD